MRPASISVLLTTLLALGLPADSLAGGYSPELRFERISMQDGLPDSNVTTILQDHLGFLWIGTLNGLVRYDGYDFLTFKPDPDEPTLSDSTDGSRRSISGRSILALHEDRAGDLWIGTRRGGLNRLDRQSGRFTHYRHDPEDPTTLSLDSVGAICEDQDGYLWVGTGDVEVKSLGGGLDRLDRTTGTFSHYRHDPDDPTSLSHSVVGSILEDSEQRLWVATPYGGLNLLDRDRGTFRRYRHDSSNLKSLAHDSISAIVERSQGGLWISTWSGALQHFDPEAETFEPLFEADALLSAVSESGPPPSSNTPIMSLFEDSNGILWFGTWQGPLVSYDPESGKVNRFEHETSDPASLSDSNGVMSITEDRAGILWFGTWRGGLNKRDPFANKFLHFTHQAGESYSLVHRRVHALHFDREGGLWIGTEGGIDRYHPKTEEVETFRHDPEDPTSLASDQVSAIHQDRDGFVWIGTKSQGLNRFDPSTGRFAHLVSDPADPQSLSNNRIMAILEDRKGWLWVGTAGGGLNRLDRSNGRCQRFRHDPESPGSLGHDWIHALYEDSTGTLWVGAEGMGLQRFDRERGLFESYFDAVSGLDTVLSIYEDSAKRLWVGTATGGLHLFDRATGKSEAMTERDGLAHDAVYAVQEDADGRLWLATGGGVSRLDPESRQFRNFDVSDGLQSQLGLAAVQSERGDLIFAGSDGLNALHPAHIADNPHPPQVALTDFKIFDRSVRPSSGAPLDVDISVASEVHLAHRQNVITFDFSGLHFSRPEANRYAYKLAGFSWDWAEVDGYNRSATYTNLSPGRYVFQVKAANADGVWTEDAAEIAVYVRPPWWQTWWAYAGYSLLALSTLVAGDRFQRARVIRGEREAARRQEAKLRTEAAELQARAAEAQAQALQAENDRKTQELEEARRLQLSMLPESIPWHPDVEVAASMQTATEVGGDYYDFNIADDGTLTLAIGDATGHGTGAGTMVTATKSLFHLLAREHDIVDMLKLSTRALKRMRLKKLYMALALARFEARTLELAGAGMPPALVFHASTGRVEEVALDGMPLGSQIRFPYRKHSMPLAPGDTVVFMSDGLPETAGTEGELFGYDRVGETLREIGEARPSEIVDHLTAAAEDWADGATREDDMTFVVLRVKDNA